ncbi:hypothetical protein NAX55_001108 [Salmonella enterica]|nr:hypothetical protein [Salmonella enterica]EJG8985300.1 hypothetical protein [Salmonella enterica]
MRQKRLVSVRMRGVGIGVWGFWATAQDGAHGVRMWLLTGRQAVRAPGCLVTTLRPDASH